MLLKNRLLPARLAIYYGYPSLVNGSGGDIKAAAAIFADYDVVVFGDGLEFNDVNPTRHPPGPGPTEHQNTRRIIDLLRQSTPRTAVYGYVDLGNSQSLSMTELERRVALWSEMGVGGIFLDEAGFDFGVTRARQNAIVQYIHRLGLSAFLNAYNPDDLFGPDATPLNSIGGGNPPGAPTSITSDDIFLLESFQVRKGEYEDVGRWASRTARAAVYRDQFGARLFAITTSSTAGEFSSSQFQYAWWSALLWSLDGFGWGGPNFNSQDNRLTWRERPHLQASTLGNRFTSSVTSKGPRYFRQTDKGKVMIDTIDHSGRFLPGVPHSRGNPRRSRTNLSQVMQMCPMSITVQPASE